MRNKQESLARKKYAAVLIWTVFRLVGFTEAPTYRGISENGDSRRIRILHRLCVTHEGGRISK